MANITRIKAQDPSKPHDPQDEPKSQPKGKSKHQNATAPSDAPSKTEAKLMKANEKKVRKAQKRAANKAAKKPFVLFRPFVAFGRYLKHSWQELRQVHWPSRKMTWKLVLAVVVYTLIFVGFLTLLDVLFDFVFSKILG